jgi:hypothetical protein
VHAGFCMFPQSCDLRTETAGSLWCVLDVLNAYTHWTSIYRVLVHVNKIRYTIIYLFLKSGLFSRRDEDEQTRGNMLKLYVEVELIWSWSGIAGSSSR